MEREEEGNPNSKIATNDLLHIKGKPEKMPQKMRSTAVTMKTLVLLTLMCILHVSMSAVSQGILFNEGCCINRSKTAIPWERVQHVERTPNGCKRKAVVVTTVCGKKFCIEANWKWARTLLTEFERLSANKTLVPPPFNQTRCRRDVQVVGGGSHRPVIM
ncbi:C-C motif chemokine 26-like [Dunckerocampus dactyliophorus]|uniref:C-C motif chemokine 26-like n=1 Tax=Dunckerocampus dactyliophorus TaxID=161453 RepID=UPI002406688B|nr:C-C motif chemokine 26-like [Dunckerocampus dactyliophorus]